MTKKQAIYRSAALLLIVALLVLGSGCGTFSGPEQKLPGSDNQAGLRIALITGLDGTADPYYTNAWKGLEQAEKELGAVIGFVSAENTKAYPAKLNELRNQKSTVIVTVGTEPVPAVIEAAKNNPGIHYICLDSYYDDTLPANVLTVTYRVEEGAFLAGYLAGRVTKSYVIGFISGSNEDYDLRYFYGYKAGIRAASSTCELMKGLAGTFTNKGRVEKLALQMTGSRADVIFHVAGSAGTGIVKAIEVPGKYGIGSYVDQSQLAPDHILTSVVLNHDLVLAGLLEQYQQQKLTFGKNISLGLADKALEITEASSTAISKDTQDKLSKHKDNIISGKLKIPDNENDYYEFHI